MRAAARLLLLAGLPALVGLALVAVALPRPSAEDRLATRVLSGIERTPLRGAVIHVGGTSVPVVCHAHGFASVLAVRGRSRLVVRGARVFVPTAPPHLGGPSGRSRLARLVDAELPAALADLAGPRGLYEKELIGRLQSGERMIQGVTTFYGIDAYRVRLGGNQPRVVLYASVRTLRPLGVSYASKRIAGTSRLVHARRHGC